jgi:hypothetical protein
MSLSRRVLLFKKRRIGSGPEDIGDVGDESMVNVVSGIGMVGVAHQSSAVQCQGEGLHKVISRGGCLELSFLLSSLSRSSALISRQMASG